MIDIDTNDVYFPYEDDGRIKSRRIIGVRDDVVIYSIGGDKNRHCKLSTMRAWLSKIDAIKANKQIVEQI